MPPFRRRAILAACCVLGFGGAAMAQPYPSHPVRIVVPYPAGGSNDIIARIVAQKLTERSGQPFLVENRGGASGNIGAEMVASSDPDGYTLLLTAPPPLTTNMALYKNLKFDPSTAFAPVSLVASVPIVPKHVPAKWNPVRRQGHASTMESTAFPVDIGSPREPISTGNAVVVHPSVPARTVNELVALAKAKPGSLDFGSSGNGSTNHLAGELLKSMTGIEIVHVPYKGAAPAMNDLIGGHIPMMFDNMPSVLPQVQAKLINAIAVAGAKRASAMPDVPTVAESGLAGFEASSWFGLVAPAKTPAPVLAKLQGEVASILQMPDVRKRLNELGAEPGTISGEAFGTYLAEETAKWSKIIRASAVTAE
jgi:tripartite-type tricarboxylate transporter receptor subunit TctC